MSVSVCTSYESEDKSVCKINVWTKEGKRLNRLKTRDSLLEWCDLLQITLSKEKVSVDNGKLTYEQFSDRSIEKHLYWDKDEIPKEAIICKGANRGKVVTMYVSFRGITTVIHYPNPLSPVWNQVIHDEDVKEFVNQNGYLIKA